MLKKRVGHLSGAFFVLRGQMKLFVGLGNPGAKYALNRHNIGFRAVDRIAEDHSFGPWRSKFQGCVSEGLFGREKVILLKPETFMNLSGQSVGAAIQFYKIRSEQISVFHDELDLAPGKIRVKTGGGHAGHNGLRSIHQHVGPDYHRVRIGIGHPGHKDRVASYVLHDFAKADQEWIDDILAGISEGASMLAVGDTARFMNAVGLRINSDRVAKPPKTGPVSKPKPVERPDDMRSPLQKLVDKFR